MRHSTFHRPVAALVALAALAAALLAGSAHATTDTAIEANVVDSAAVLTQQMTDTWDQVAEVFVATNRALDTAAANASQLYVSADRAAFVAALSSAPCMVQEPAVYTANATAAYAYLCCQVRRLRSPAFHRVTQFLGQYYFGVAIDMVGPTAERAIINLAKMQARDLRGYVAGACKDDRRLHDNQQSLVLAREANVPVAGTLLSAYNVFAREARNNLLCIGQPLATTGCAQNAEVTLAQIAPNTGFILNDPGYAEVCSPAALDAFEQARIFSACA